MHGAQIGASLAPQHWLQLTCAKVAPSICCCCTQACSCSAHWLACAAPAHMQSPAHSCACAQASKGMLLRKAVLATLQCRKTHSHSSARHAKRTQPACNTHSCCSLLACLMSEWLAACSRSGKPATEQSENTTPLPNAAHQAGRLLLPLSSSMLHPTQISPC